MGVIKRALGTKKVGHTGTLDSFADGLLVVAVGSLTRLVSHITLFDKTYDAIISFGTQTDTLDPHGCVICKADLPNIDDFEVAVDRHTGEITQIPPQYSAIHVNGKRASDIARAGKNVDIPPRSVTVYRAEILDTQTVGAGVQYAHVRFFVSKGTYIRCLARDIAKACGSCAHLIALRRTAVGSFLLEDAVGAETLPDFTIQNAVNALQETDQSCFKENIQLSENHITDTLRGMTADLARECNITPIILKDAHHFDFFHGKLLLKHMFEPMPSETAEYAVFTHDNCFAGIITGQQTGTRIFLRYAFVIPM